MRAIHHWEAQKLAAAGKRAIPIKAIVGAMARGPMNLSMRPMRPLKPMTTWNNDASMIAPCI